MNINRFLILTVLWVILGESAFTSHHKLSEDIQISDKKQSSVPSLPIELQAYICSFLDNSSFIKVRSLSRSWRDASKMSGRMKVIDLSGKKLEPKDWHVLKKSMFSTLILKNQLLTEEIIQNITSLSRFMALDLSRGHPYIHYQKDILNLLSHGSLTSLMSLNLSNFFGGLRSLENIFSGNLTSLTSLDLSGNGLKENHIEALASSQTSSLLHLNLSRNEIGDKGAKFIASGNFVSLESLKLNHCSIDYEGARFIGNGKLPALRSLSMTESCIAGARAKYEMTRRENTSSNDFSSIYDKILTESYYVIEELLTKSLSSLTDLDLSYNQLNYCSVYQYGATYYMYRAKIDEEQLDEMDIRISPALVRLNLSRNYLHTFNFTWISALQALQELNLSHTELKDDSITGNMMTTISSAPALKILNLESSGIGTHVFSVISNGSFSNLTDLNLQNNRIEDFGVTIKSLPALITLNLDHNLLGPISMKEFISSKFPSLRKLVLSYNEIFNKGVTAFSLDPLTTLTMLDLTRTRISIEGARLVVQTLPNLRHLCLGGNVLYAEDRAKLLEEKSEDQVLTYNC